MSNYILAIGIDQYQNCNLLSNPVKDLEDIIDVLVNRYDFEKRNIKKIFDKEATLKNIIDAFEELIYSQTPADNILILFAGHGEYDENLNAGFLLPVDCVPYSKATYLSYSVIFDYIRALKSHHVLLVSDSCFSGAIFGIRNINRDTAKDKLDKIPSKWALTSGRIEPVLDGRPGGNSPFASALIKTLEFNNNSLLSVVEIADKVISLVAGHVEQIPRGEPLQNLGHKGGQYIFRLRNNSTVSNLPASVTSTDTSNLISIINDYYDLESRIESAENESKTATARRLSEERDNVNIILKREILKEFESRKEHSGLSKILSKEHYELYKQLQDIKIEKNQVVRSQQYQEAALLRDREKNLLARFLKISPLKDQIEQLKLDPQMIFEHYSLLTNSLNIMSLSDYQQIQEQIISNFTMVYLMKLSYDHGLISKYKYQASIEELSEVFEGTKQRIIYIFNKA